MPYAVKFKINLIQSHILDGITFFLCRSYAVIVVRALF